MGYGSAGFSCDRCNYRHAIGTSRSRLSGWTFGGSIGWAPSSHTRLGLVYEGWLNGLKPGDSLPALEFFNVVATYSPLRRGGPFIETGWGYSYYSLELGTGDVLEPVSETTDAFATGSGQSYRLGLGWNGKGGFTPRVTYVVGRERRVHLRDGTVARGWKEKMLFVVIEARTPDYRPRWPDPE